MKFIIATGGSGGHLFPAFKVAEELKTQGHDTFLGSFHRTRELVQKSGFTFEDLGARGFTGTFGREMFGSMIAMARAVFRALRSIKKIRPDAVLGFGGYGAFPVILSAIVLRYPTLIHEQNVIPGRANALLARFVKKIAISFKESTRYFNPEKTVLTGCPCHSPDDSFDRTEIYGLFKLDPNKKTILVLGGSQGSRHINKIFVESARFLREKLDFQVIHVTGQQDDRDLRDQYNHLGISFALFKFLDKMKEAYAIADLVISRSGAVTVSEIASFRLPAVFIPYPHARGHQRENASVLCEANLSRMIEEKELSASMLTETILDLLEYPVNIKEKEEIFKDICFPAAALRLAEEAVKLK